MKAKIRPNNLSEERRRELDAVAREYVRQKVEEYSVQIKWISAMRSTLAMALALSDQCGFGTVRIRRVIEGVTEILGGVADEVYEVREQDDFAGGVDKVSDGMMRELIDRGIEIVFEGDKAYGDIDTICARLGIEKKKKPSGVGASESKSKGDNQ